MIERIVRDFGIQMLPSDLYCVARTNNRLLESLGRPRRDAFDEISSDPPTHPGCNVVGMFDPIEIGRGRFVPFQPPS